MPTRGCSPCLARHNDWIHKLLLLPCPQESALMPDLTSYFFTREKRSRLKKVAQPSMAYELPVKISVVFFL